MATKFMREGEGFETGAWAWTMEGGGAKDERHLTLLVFITPGQLHTSLHFVIRDQERISFLTKWRRALGNYNNVQTIT